MNSNQTIVDLGLLGRFSEFILLGIGFISYLVVGAVVILFGIALSNESGDYLLTKIYVVIVVYCSIAYLLPLIRRQNVKKYIYVKCICLAIVMLVNSVGFYVCLKTSGSVFGFWTIFFGAHIIVPALAVLLMIKRFRLDQSRT